MEDFRELEEYIESKIDVSNFTDTEKKEVIDGLVKNISTATSIAVLEKLNEKDKKEFLKLSESKDEAEILEFSQSKVQNLELLVTQTIDNTIAEYNELVKN